MRLIENYIICFFVYCFVGWLWETIPNSYRAKKFVNRGFLNGPVIPIYGVGALMVYLILAPDDMGILPLFLSSGILTVTLEYLTSWSMEKLFHARWWDYSNKPFNLNGRIYLTGFIAFGAFSVIVIKWAQPSLMSQVAKMSDMVALIFCIVAGAIFIMDLILTVNHVLKMPQRLEAFEKEVDAFMVSHNIETRDNAIIEYLKPSNIAVKLENVEKELHSYQAKRLINAFPNIKVLGHNEIVSSIGKQINKISRKK